MGLTGNNSSNSNEGEKLGADFTGVEERIVPDVDGMFSSIFEYPWSEVAISGFSLDLQFTQNSSESDFSNLISHCVLISFLVFSSRNSH